MSIRRQLLLCLVLCSLTARRVAAHGEFDDELRRLDALLAAAPEDAPLWFQRSSLNLSHGEWKQALYDVERVERIAEGKYPVGFVRGQALAGGGQFAEARRALDGFLKLHPGHAPALALRARVLVKLDKPADAFTDFRAALARFVTPAPDLYQEFAEALAAQGCEAEAVSVLQAGINKLGEIPSLIIKALELEVATGEFGAALSRVDAMQKAAPRPEPWMAKRASLLAQAGRADDSRAAWQALAAHIAALPGPVRSSHSMSLLAEQAASHFKPVAAPPGSVVKAPSGDSAGASLPLKTPSASTNASAPSP